MKKATDRKLRIYGPFVLFLVGTLFFRLNWYFELTESNLLVSNLIGLAAGYICWNTTRWAVKQIQKRLPGLSNTRRRLVWMAFLLPVLVNFGWLIRKVAHLALHTTDGFWPTLPDYTYSIGIQVFYHCVYYVIYEGSYVLEAWHLTYAQNEQYKKNKLQQQLNLLKGQINPHFLFNSLNSLSMLIHENPRQAEAFVDELSSVYRYLLRNNQNPDSDRELTTLDRELQFIQSYFRLLKTRYGEGIALQINVDEGRLSRQIPPLTLQLLVENAVKHNVILPESPLLVEIFTQDEQLVVQNTLQRKTALHSTKVGLANIATKYKLLGPYAISIREEAERFVVAVPLLTPQPHLVS